VADYLSRPVVVGYIHGVAVVLIVSQLPKLLGVTVSAHDPLPKLVDLVGKLGSASWATFALGAVAIATLLAVRHYAPRFPAPLVVLVLLFLTNPLSYLPTTILAAVIVCAAIGLFDVGAWRGLAATHRVEVAIAAVTMGGVLTIGVLEAIVLAVGLSIIDVVRR